LIRRAAEDEHAESAALRFLKGGWPMGILQHQCFSSDTMDYLLRIHIKRCLEEDHTHWGVIFPIRRRDVYDALNFLGISAGCRIEYYLLLGLSPLVSVVIALLPRTAMTDDFWFSLKTRKIMSDYVVQYPTLAIIIDGDSSEEMVIQHTSRVQCWLTTEPLLN
jgi:hypothetical protein